MPNEVQGVLKLTKKGGGQLRDPGKSFRQQNSDPVVPAKLVKQHELAEGAFVAGETAGRGNQVKTVTSVCGLDIDAWKARKRFADLVAIDPCERFDLSQSDNITMRIVDMVAPIGKGTRGLIVSPPKAGKTMILEQLAHAIEQCDPEARIVILLLDERPEEVTHFRRATNAEVLSSSSDQTVAEHIELAELTLAHIRCELECGRNVVILADSLTRMGRAFNLSSSGKGRMMSGGVEAGALEIPRRFFGLARNIEDGGSVTIVATALIDTGSRMDQYIFEEFKGTGNSEIVLDRSLAEHRIFPAIDLAQSGTRKEHKLFPEDDMKRLGKLRRVLAERKPKEAMESLLKLMEKHSTNRAFLDSIPA